MAVIHEIHFQVQFFVNYVEVPDSGSLSRLALFEGCRPPSLDEVNRVNSSNGCGQDDSSINIGVIIIIIIIIRPHCLNAVRGCGVLLEVLHVAWSVGLCVCVLITRMSCAKMAEPIEMLFGRLTHGLVL